MLLGDVLHFVIMGEMSASNELILSYCLRAFAMDNIWCVYCSCDHTIVHNNYVFFNHLIRINET